MKRGINSRFHTASIRQGAVIVRLATSIKKFGPVDMVENDSPRLRPVPTAPFTVATYGPIAQTCPDTCSFKAKGPTGVRPCFADAGFTKKTIRTLEAAARRRRPVSIARDEARAIDLAFPAGVPQDGARGGRDLRLHISGDVRDAESARVLAGAAKRWRARGGGRVWTYSHSWARVPREAWGEDISVLASVERPFDVIAARVLGYAAAIVVREHPSEKTWCPDPENYPDVKIVPCPYETRKVTCGECRLCLDRDLHKLGITIGFAMHGTQAAEGRRRLPVLT